MSRHLKITLLALTLGLASITPAVAANEDGVCAGLDSGKIDVSGEVDSVTIKAPDGYVLTGYCVKAGSAVQGDGPVYVDLNGETSYTITYPTGKGISHYSYSYEPAPAQIITVVAGPAAPGAPTCDAHGTLPPLPMTTGVTYMWDRAFDGPGTYTLTATANEGYVFAAGVTTSWMVTVAPQLTGPSCDEGEDVVITVVAGPAAPGAPTCDADGTLPPLPMTTGVTYSWDRVFDGPGTYTLTAVADEGYVFAPGVTTSWTVAVGAQLTGPYCEEGGSIVITVVAAPVAPGAPTCDMAGTLPSLPMTVGVTYVWDRTFTGPGTYTLTAMADAGYEFAPGVTTSWTVTVAAKLTGEVCTGTLGGTTTGGTVTTGTTAVTTVLQGAVRTAPPASAVVARPTFTG
jgi:hypothetical protein